LKRTRLKVSAVLTAEPFARVGARRNVGLGPERRRPLTSRPATEKSTAATQLDGRSCRRTGMTHYVHDLPLGISLELFFDEQGGVVTARWLWCDLVVGTAEVGRPEPGTGAPVHGRPVGWVAAMR
jgi:hypothetical protein